MSNRYKSSRSFVEETQRKDLWDLSVESIKLALINAVLSAYGINRVFVKILGFITAFEEGSERLNYWLRSKNEAWYTKNFGKNTKVIWDVEYMLRIKREQRKEREARAQSASSASSSKPSEKKVRKPRAQENK